MDILNLIILSYKIKIYLEEYRRLMENKKLKYICHVNAEFIERGNYFDFMNTEINRKDIRLGTNIAFIKMYDRSKDLMENYLGFLNISPGGGTRNFIKQKID